MVNFGLFYIYLCFSYVYIWEEIQKWEEKTTYFDKCYNDH